MGRHQRLLFCVVCLYALFSLYVWIKDERRKSREKFVPTTGNNVRDQQHPPIDTMNDFIVPCRAFIERQLKMDDFIRRHPVPGFQLSSDNGLVEYLHTASCKPIPASLLLFNRIFKTGSETMGLQFQLVAGMTGYVYSKRKFVQVSRLKYRVFSIYRRTQEVFPASQKIIRSYRA